MTTETISTRSIVAAVIGNSLEWFDLIVYAFFAPVIAELFFPVKDSSVSLVYTLGTFGLSFVIRPVGAVVVGRFADRAGRRNALILVTSLMFVGTALIAMLPTYSQIGLAAPALLLVARLIQGFSAGGEFGSATAYLVEQSPNRRGFYSSWQFASQGAATLVASGIGVGLYHLFDQRTLTAWAWRIPFIAGLLIGPVAYFIRQHAAETPEFTARLSATHGEAIQAATPAFFKVLTGCGTVLVATVSMYLMLYMSTFAQTVLHLDASSGYISTMVGGLALLIVPPLTGALSDRIGRFSVALPPAVLLVVLPIPLFLWLVDGPARWKLLLVQGLLSGIIGAYLGTLPAFLSELFPLQARTTGLALSYNIAVVAAGGFAPMVFVLLVRWTGSSASPSFYLAFAAALSTMALLAARRLRWLI